MQHPLHTHSHVAHLSQQFVHSHSPLPLFPLPHTTLSSSPTPQQSKVAKFRAAYDIRNPIKVLGAPTALNPAAAADDSAAGGVGFSGVGESLTGLPAEVVAALREHRSKVGGVCGVWWCVCEKHSVCFRRVHV